jgi:2-(1,2-epoxy-1,2-dihydrophenyl)acetyl-CoA isomerase
MTELTGVRYLVEDGVAVIMLARPEASNSVDLTTAGSVARSSRRKVSPSEPAPRGGTRRQR